MYDCLYMLWFCGMVRRAQLRGWIWNCSYWTLSMAWNGHSGADMCAWIVGYAKRLIEW